MHYCMLLVTKDIPTRNKIDEIMKPYCWDNIEADEDGNVIEELPVFTWDWYQIGGRYCGNIKLKIDEDDKKYEWGYLSREGRNNKLFISSIIDELQEGKPKWQCREEDYFPYMGGRENFLYVDGAIAKDILNIEELSCFGCIKPDGSAIVRQSWEGKSRKFTTDENYDEKFKEIIKENMDGFFTYLDIHD